MKKTFALLAATTTLTAIVALPATSAMLAPSGGGNLPDTLGFAADSSNTLPLVFVSDDDDDDDDDDDRRWSRRDHDDDDGCDDDDDDDRKGRDEDTCPAALLNSAPLGTTAPPQNGLFTNGAQPQVRVK